MATFINSNGEKKEVSPINESDFQLDELQEFVSGYIEIIDLRDDRYMVLNEEGKLIGLEENVEATRIAQETGALSPGDYIVGNVLIANYSEIR